MGLDGRVDHGGTGPSLWCRWGQSLEAGLSSTCWVLGTASEQWIFTRGGGKYQLLCWSWDRRGGAQDVSWCLVRVWMLEQSSREANHLPLTCFFFFLIVVVCPCAYVVCWNCGWGLAPGIMFRYMGLGGRVDLWRSGFNAWLMWGHSLEEGLSPVCRLVGTSWAFFNCGVHLSPHRLLFTTGEILSFMSFIVLVKLTFDFFVLLQIFPISCKF